MQNPRPRLRGERLFRTLRMRRRQPKPPFNLLELDLPFDEVMADLVYPTPV